MVDDLREGWFIWVKKTKDHEWYNICLCDTPEGVSNVIRTLTGCREKGPAEIKIEYATETQAGG